MTIDELNALTTLTAGDELPVWDVEASAEEPTKKITAQNMANSVKTLGSLVNTTEMNNAIAQSTATTAQTISLNSDYTTGGYCRCLKYGKVVTIILDTTFKTLSTKSSIIANGLPIPLDGTVIFNLINGSGAGARLIINSSGQLKTEFGKIPNAEFYSGTVTYISV